MPLAPRSATRPLAILAVALATALLLSESAGLAQAGDSTPAQIAVPLTLERDAPSPHVAAASLDGHPLQVLDTTTLRQDGGEKLEIVLLFDLAVSSTQTMHELASELADQAQPLSALGRIEILVTDPDVRTFLPPTDQPALVRNALERLAVDIPGQDAIRERRELYRAERDSDEKKATELAFAAASDEVAMQQRHTDGLLDYLAEHGRNQAGQTPRILVWASEGAYADPLDFYLGQTPDAEAAEELLDPLGERLPKVTDLASVASVAGWVVVPIRLEPSDEAHRLRYTPTEDLPVGFRLKLGGGGARRPPDGRAEEPVELFETGDSPWRTLAELTAGAVVERPSELRSTLARLLDAPLLRVEVPASSLADLEQGSGAFEARREDGTRLPAPPTVGWRAPALVAQARARLVLAGELTNADFDVGSTLLFGSGETARLQATPELPKPEALDAGPWRFTAAIHTYKDAIVYRSAVLPTPAAPPNGDTPAEETPTAPTWTLDLVVPSGTDNASVIVEDLSSRRWGIGFVRFVLPERSAPIDPRDIQESLLQIEPPPLGPMSGKITIHAKVTDPVARVEFLLNGKRVARRSHAPYEAEIDVGQTGRMQQLVAVAYDRDHNEIDRDRLVINEPPTSFWVRFTEPDPGSRVAGPTEVETQLRLPSGGRLAGIDIFWKDTRLTTLTSAPYRATIDIPIGEPEGYLRAQARLVDGRIAEDTLVVSRSGFGEQIGVDLVELYVVATDRNERPVLGLEREDFTVLEDQRKQVIESFEFAGNLPLTLGLAIDSSSSLFVRMPAVKRAASDFVSTLDPGRDRAFLIGFGSEPRLVTPVSTNLTRIRDGIRSLEPFGSTAVWGALSMSLEQLEGMSGRRALVVFYDGDDEDEEARFRQGLQLARRARVPIYMILVNNEAARTDGRSLSSRAFVNRLERIARAGGGRVFYVRTNEDLEPIFDAIAQELRSHYLISYYPTVDPGGPLWRPVEVDVDRRGIEARTIEGRGIE